MVWQIPDSIARANKDFKAKNCGVSVVTDQENRRNQVLLIAENANPEWVSVPLVGWSLSNAIAKKTNAHVVTQLRNRDAFIRAGLTEGTDFTAIDSELWAARAEKLGAALRMGHGKGWTTVMALQALAYPYFEKLVFEKFGKDLAHGKFDLVHRITPLSPTVVSPLAAKCERLGVPFLMGPMNGGIPWPKGFNAERRREREWLSYIRSAYKLAPGRRRALNATRAIICGSRHTQSEYPQEHQPKCVYIPENAIDPARFSLEPKLSISTPLRACFIGRLVPYKGPDMLLDALAEFLKSGQLTLDIIGDGPMREALEKQSEDLGIAQALTFHGFVEHRKVQTVVRDCDLFTFPSVREFGGGVVLEAMSLGVVPVIVDYGGPGELVTPDTGFAVPIGSRVSVIENMRQSVRQAIENPEALIRMKKAARQSVLDFYTWDKKAEQVLQVYDWVLGRREALPEPLGERYIA